MNKCDKKNWPFVHNTIRYVDSKHICSIAVVLVFVLLIWSTKRQSSATLWNKYKHNPILGNRSTGSYFDPYVLVENNTYIIYFSERKHGGIVVSHSKDGYHWSEPLSALNRSNATGWEETINRCSVLHYKNKYYMYYTGQQAGKSKLGIAQSDDGITFERMQADPIMISTESFEKDSVMNPFVLFDYEENVFKMWYSAGETYEPDVICYATSSDGKRWIKNPSNPILTKGTHSYDREKVSVGHVLKIGKQYLMFYICYRTIDSASICVASSLNGVDSWNTQPDNPIISPSHQSWDQNACYHPTVSYSVEKDKWMLWYNGRRREEEYIGLAIASEWHPVWLE